jgi:hypothetical protein
MPSIGNWKPYENHVQGGLREGNFVNGQFITLCAGPPFLRNLSSSGVSQSAGLKVYPIGLTQNITLGQMKNVSRIFEIGSDRSYFLTGRSAGQLGLGRVVYHGPSLLRVLYAYYDTEGDVGSFEVKSLFTKGDSPFGVPPFRDGNLGETFSDKATDKRLHSIKVPPGYGNFFINLASDLFSQPMGLLLIVRDNEENTYGACYFENCYVPNHNFGLDANGLLVQESIGIQYEKLVPIRLAQLGLIQDIGGTGGDGFLADQTGGWNNAKAGNV